MQDYSVTLRACGIFDQLSDKEMGEVVAKAPEVFYEAQATIIKKNEVPEGLYILHTGSLCIYNEDVLITTLQPPAIIGESFIANSTATATIVAETRVSAFMINRDDFFVLSGKYPSIIQSIFRLTIQRLRQSNDAAMHEAHSRTEALVKMVDERTAELQVTMEELRQTQKFRDLFLANMSHEIRTPMNAIVGLTNLLTHTKLDEQQNKYLQVIKKSGDNLLVIINDILDLSKIEAGKMELEQVPMHLHQTVESIGTILQIKAAEKKLALVVDIDAAVPEYVLGDETRLTQILMNLTGNAIKFTQSGEVRISATVTSRNNDITAIKFAVSDTGIGIPEDKLETIFESFGQASSDTTRKFGGTGLGLSISRQLVALHQSNLDVTSTLGKGTTFFFTIEYPVAEAPVLPTNEAVTDVISLAGRTLLLVDDDEFNQMVAVDTLKWQFPDLHVDTAENGRTAIALATANDYDIILMDINLPDVDGYGITKYIRTELPAPKNNVWICALTASVSKERLDLCIKAGMHDHLLKPFTPQALREKVLRGVLGS